jgi:hypothetical protein
MPNETVITINIGAGKLIVGLVSVFVALLVIVWKGKKEIAETVRSEIKPFENIAHAITEIQTVLRNKFKGLDIKHSLVEKSGSPLRPTEYGAKLIRESGLEKVLNNNQESLCIKLKASLPNDFGEYDVQENSRALLLGLKDDPIMKPVKEYVYSHPIDIEIILRAGGLWLRDDFLKQPRKINSGEAD